MTPTPELRWVIRETREPWPDPWNMRIDDNGQVVPEKVSSFQFLQQLWTGEIFHPADYSQVFGKYHEEWRDVPIEKEQS